MATPGTQAQTNEVLREAQAAHATNNLLQGIINGASDLIAALDLNFRFIAFNQPYAGEFAKIFGTVPTEGMHLFDAFRQESTDATHSYGGSGLGLAITKQLVEKMQGSITVQSAKGCGSRFTISFPIAENETTQPDRAHPPEDLPNPRRCHFLLVEDDPDTQTLIVDLLPDQCALTVAVNAEEAITAAQRVLNTTGRPFDAVLMDINLGGGPSGTDVLNMLRAIPAYRTVPIAALTAYALPGDRERFLLFGFDAYIRSEPIRWCKPRLGSLRLATPSPPLKGRG